MPKPHHPDPEYHLAYVFERFPSFTQTFCVREVLELERQGLRPLLFSIRDTRDEVPRNFPDELYDRVIFLPEEKALVEDVKALKAEGKLPQCIVLTLRHWKEKADTRDKVRVYEAAWIGQKMLEHGVTHSHSHFAGVGARTGWWLRFFYDFTFSFTGHANDLWCPDDFALSREMLFEDASLIVTVSDYTVRDLNERFSAATSKTKRVYNGLNLAPFQAVAEARNADAVWKGGEPPLIFSVGRLIEKKGYDDLIRACGMLKTQGKKFRCTIVGDGPMEDELNAMIGELGLQNEVELAGPKSQDEILEYLSGAAIFALPCVTEHDGGKDNLPTVIMEAMGASVVCASTILAGVPEMIIDHETGRLVPEREPEQFAGILADLLADPKRSEEMAALGKKRAEALFAKEETAKQMRRHLVRFGLVNYDPDLIAHDPELKSAFQSQKWMRLRRKFRRLKEERYA